MSTRRMARVASMIREVVSTAILCELRDPRIRNITVLGAEVTPDLRYARVRVSVMGDEKTAALSMHGLNSARGFLQSRIAEYIRSRYTPELRFELDDGIKKSLQTSATLKQVLSEEGQTQETSADGFEESDFDDTVAPDITDSEEQQEDNDGNGQSG